MGAFVRSVQRNTSRAGSVHKNFGDLQDPFLATVVAMTVLAFAYDWSRPHFIKGVHPFTLGLVVGTLSVVALYAALRHLLEQMGDR